MNTYSGLGLILGTRLYYQFWDAEQLDDAAFEKRLDSVVREIGERGRGRSTAKQTPAVPLMPEGVPPAAAAAAAALAPRTPTASSTPRAAETTTLSQSFSPSVFQPLSAQTGQLQPQLQPHGGVTSASEAAYLCEMMSFMREERQTMVAAMERQRQELEAKVAALTPSPPSEAVSEGALAALQARLESMHAAKLLSDAELYSVEDMLADFVELKASMAGQPITEAMIYAPLAQQCSTASTLHKLVRLSASMVGDVAFARQLRRKFV
jgi:hypothetical protein